MAVLIRGVTACLLLCSFVFAETVKLTERKQERNLAVDGRELAQTIRYFDLDTGQNKYTISYTCYVDPKTGTYIAGTHQSAGIGLIGPLDRGGWGRDFFNVRSQGEALPNCRPEITTNVGLWKAGVNFVWTWKSGRIVTARFLGRANDPFLYVAVQVRPPAGGSAAPFETVLFTIPTITPAPPHMYAQTGARKAGDKETLMLNPGENWVACLDDYWDFAKEGRPANAAGLVLDPAGFDTAKVAVYTVQVSVFLTSRGEDERFALLETKEMGNEDFVGLLKQNTPAVLGNLSAADLFQVEEKIKIQPPNEGRGDGDQ